jgi:hypothetical protein
MDRTPAQSAERRDPSTEQQGPSAEQHSQSAERSNPSAEQQDPSDEQRSQSEEQIQQRLDKAWKANKDNLIRVSYPVDIERYGPPYDIWTISDLEELNHIRDSTHRNLVHLRSQTKALREAVVRAKESSIKRQLKFLNSAFKEYQDACERGLGEMNLTLKYWNDDMSLLEWMMAWGRKDYEEAMSWVDDFFEHQEKEKAAQEAEALKAAKAKKLQRLADNLIEDEMDAHGKVSDAENAATGGPEDADEVQDKIEDLELTLKKLRKAAIELEDAAGEDNETLYRQARATRRKAEEKILATVRKLKRRLPSPEGSDAGSYVPTGGRRNDQDGRGNQSSINDTFISALTATTEAFTGAMKLTTNKPGSQSWPTFDGSYKEFYAFKREYELHLGNRTDIGDDIKASLLKLNCLKGKLRDEFKNYT